MYEYFPREIKSLMLTTIDLDVVILIDNIIMNRFIEKELIMRNSILQSFCNAVLSMILIFKEIDVDWGI